MKTLQIIMVSFVLIATVIISPVFGANTTITFDAWGESDGTIIDNYSKDGFTWYSFYYLADGSGQGGTNNVYTDLWDNPTGHKVVWDGAGTFDFISFDMQLYPGEGSGMTFEGYNNNSRIYGPTLKTLTGSYATFTFNWTGIDEIRITPGGENNLDNFVYFSATSPTISTTAASSIASTSATMGGNASSDGGASITERGVVYSTSDSTPIIGEAGVTKDTNGTGTGLFSESIASLSTGTTYYFQAYATNLAGTSYGGVQNFTTTTPNNSPAIAINNTNLYYTENTAATQIDSAATLTDSDGDADWNGGTLVAQITANNEAADEISISDSDGDGTNITVSGTNILANGTDIGDLSGSGGLVTNGTALTITFDSDATNTNVQEVLQSLRYRNSSNDPGTSNRIVTLTATDQTSASNNDTRTIAVTSVNDEPTLTATGFNPTFTEGDAAKLLYNSASVSTIESGQTFAELILTVTNINDDSAEELGADGSTITLTDGTSGTTVTNSLSYSVSISGTDATVTFSGGTMSTAATQTLVDGLTYRNTSNDPNTSNRVVTLTSLKDSGGTANGGDDTNVTLSIASTVTVAADNDAPTANANTGLTLDEGATGAIPTSKLSATDVDNDDATLSFTVTAGSSNGQLENTDSAGTPISSFTQQNLIDGKIQYVHDGGETLSDSFTFKVSDGANELTGQTFNITVNGFNDNSPVGVADSYTIDIDQTRTVSTPGILDNDTDADSVVSLTATLISAPTHYNSFTLNSDGSFSYTHDGTYSGNDSFTYLADDGLTQSATTTVTLVLQIKSVADNEISVSPSAYRFGVETLSNCASSTPVTFTVSNDDTDNRDIGTISFSGTDSDQFSLGTDNCSNTTVAGSGSCTVEIKFCPTSIGSKAANLLIPSDDVETPTLSAQLYNHEDAAEEAGRRLPPVLYALSIPETMTEGNTYTLTWSLLGYHNSYMSNIVFFDCSGIGDGSCGEYSNSRFDFSGHISPISSSAGPFIYNGEQSQIYNYNYDFTAPAVSGTTDIVIRFYRKSSSDAAAGKGGLSLLIPGGLSNTYYDDQGRRIQKQIVK